MNAVSDGGVPTRALEGRWTWLFPATYLLHIAEEAWCGVTFPTWVSNLWGIDFSRGEFFALNAVAWLVMCAAIVWILVARSGHAILIALGFVIALNGAAHVVASALTASYSPGTVTGMLLWIPLGLRTLSIGRRVVSPVVFGLGCGLGFGLHALVSWLAFRAGS